MKNQIFTSFSFLTEVPVTVFNDQMEIVLETNKENKICRFFDIYNQKQSICGKNLSFSCDLASKLGEPYIFICPSGFVNVAVAIFKEGKFDGACIAGPVAMGPILEDTVKDLFKIHESDADIFSKVTIFLRSMKIHSTKHVHHLSNILNTCVEGLNNQYDNDNLNLLYKEPRRIEKDIPDNDLKEITTIYPFEKEKELISRIKEGDNEGANKTFRVLLNEILLMENGNLEVVKARILEICVILSRVAVEGGASLQKIFGINYDLINSLNKIETVQGIIHWSGKMTDHFVKNIFDNLYTGTSDLINQVVQHINTHFMNKITLEKLADHFHINASYLSRLFKQEMETTFNIYLNQVRIKRAKELLKETNMVILDIAIYVGYEDQSYFSKVFKKNTGQTPYQFKKTTTR